MWYLCITFTPLYIALVKQLQYYTIFYFSSFYSFLSISSIMSKIQGKVIFITDKEDKSKQAGKNFFVQDIGIETSDDINGTIYRNPFKFQAKADKTALLDTIGVGDKVEIEYGIKCSSFAKKPEIAKTERNPQHLDIIVNLELNDIVVKEKASAVQSSGTDTNTATSNTGTSTYTVEGLEGTFTKGVKPTEIPTGFIWNEGSGMIAKSDLPF